MTFIAISLPVPAVVACGDDDAPAFRDAAIWLAEVTGGKVHWLPGRHACAIEKSAEVRRSAGYDAGLSSEAAPADPAYRSR